MATIVNNNTVTNSKACTTGSKASKYKLYLQITENSYDITTNTSNVTYKGWIKGTTTVTSFYGYPMSGTIKNGNTTLASGSVTATSSKPVNSANAYTLASGTSNFTHNSDGTLTLNLTFEYSSNSPHAKTGSVSTTLTLTRIPRASTIVAIDCNIESATNITINKADPNFTTTLSYSFAGTTGAALTGTIVEKTTNNVYGWTVPSSFYAKIPNSKTGICTLTATTYSGNTVIGSSTTNFTVTASEASSAPAGTLTVIDTNNATTTLTGDNNKIVKGQSTAQCTITKSAQNSATITSVKINGTEIGTSVSTYNFPNVNTDTFTLLITDSRGYTKTVNVTKTLVDYIPVTAKANFARNTSTDGIVNLKYDGNYFNSSFGTTNNALNTKYRYKESGGNWSNWITLSPTKSGNTYSQQLQLEQTFIYTKAFDFELQASDKLTNVTVTSSIKQGIPIYWWNKDSFNIEVDGYVKGSKITTIDIVYPVGSIYITTSNVNPSTLFGGTWEQIRDRFLLAAGSTYSAGSMGGSATHKLTIQEMPRHTHEGTKHLQYDSSTTGYSTSWSEQHYKTDDTGETGGDTPFSIMPPYLTVYVWKRVS